MKTPSSCTVGWTHDGSANLNYELLHEVPCAQLAHPVNYMYYIRPVLYDIINISLRFTDLVKVTFRSVLITIG